MTNYGAYGTLGSSGGGSGPSTSIQIDVTQVLGGTAKAVLFVNPDLTLGDDENGFFEYDELTSYLQVGDSSGAVGGRGFVWVRGFASSQAQPSAIGLVAFAAAENDAIYSWLQSSNKSGQFPTFAMSMTAGSIGSESTTNTHDTLGRVAWYQYWAGGDSLTTLGYIEGYNDGAIVNTQRPQGIAICTGSLPLSTPSDRMIVDHNGEIGVNYPRFTPLYGLFGILSPGGLPTTPIFYVRDDTDSAFITTINVDKTMVNSGAVAFDAIQTDTSGGASVVMDDFVRALYIDPAAPIVGLAIDLPQNPYDGQEVLVSFGGTITSGSVASSITWNGLGNPILMNMPITSAVAGDGFMFKFQATGHGGGIWRMF